MLTHHALIRTNVEIRIPLQLPSAAIHYRYQWQQLNIWWMPPNSLGKSNLAKTQWSKPWWIAHLSAEGVTTRSSLHDVCLIRALISVKFHNTVKVLNILHSWNYNHLYSIDYIRS